MRVVLVTGAGRGIGAAIAARFARAGDRVALLDRDADAAADTAAALRQDGADAQGFAADVTDADDVARASADIVARWGAVDVLVNNAGRNTYLDPVAMDESDWDDAFAVDLKAAWLVSRAVLPGMIERGSGAIVNISSIHARLTTPGMFPYAAAKSGLEGLTRSLAVEYAPHGIRVNAVAPGWTRTRLVDEWVERSGDPEALARVERAHPLGRIAEPEDVAAAVEFLSGDGARAITGAVLPVDAGLSIGFRVD